MEDYVSLVCSDEVPLVHCVREKALNALAGAWYEVGSYTAADQCQLSGVASKK